jgi:TrmH family RNA methyltransferase
VTGGGVPDQRITSPRNARLKSWIELQRHGAARREQGRFIVEGRRLVATALAAGAVETLIRSDKLAPDDPLVAMAREAGAEVVDISAAAFGKLADVPSPQGIAAVARVAPPEPAELFTGRAFLLVACGIQEPGNLGAMMRSAHAAGATGLVALPPSADLRHPRAVRGSAGAILLLPAARMEEAEFIERASRVPGMRLLAAEPSGGVSHREADYSRPLAVVIGGEGGGVPETLASRAEAVTIPMREGAESLNAAAAAAVILFEAAGRVRPATPPGRQGARSGR